VQPCGPALFQMATGLFEGEGGRDPDGVQPRLQADSAQLSRQGRRRQRPLLG
jgi:hypothetical protein